MHRNQEGARDAQSLRNVRTTTSPERTTEIVEDKPGEAGEAEEDADEVAVAVVVAVFLLVRLSKRYPQVVGTLRGDPYRSEVNTSIMVSILQQLPQ